LGSSCIWSPGATQHGYRQQARCGGSRDSAVGGHTSCACWRGKKKKDDRQLPMCHFRHCLAVFIAPFLAGLAWYSYQALSALHTHTPAAHTHTHTHTPLPHTPHLHTHHTHTHTHHHPHSTTTPTYTTCHTTPAPHPPPTLHPPLPIVILLNAPYRGTILPYLGWRTSV